MRRQRALLLLVAVRCGWLACVVVVGCGIVRCGCGGVLGVVLRPSRLQSAGAGTNGSAWREELCRVSAAKRSRAGRQAPRSYSFSTLMILGFVICSASFCTNPLLHISKICQCGGSDTVSGSRASVTV